MKGFLTPRSPKMARIRQVASVLAVAGITALLLDFVTLRRVLLVMLIGVMLVTMLAEER